MPGPSPVRLPSLKSLGRRTRARRPVKSQRAGRLTTVDYSAQRPENQLTTVEGPRKLAYSVAVDSRRPVDGTPTRLSGILTGPVPCSPAKFKVAGPKDAGTAASQKSAGGTPRHRGLFCQTARDWASHGREPGELDPRSISRAVEGRQTKLAGLQPGTAFCSPAKFGGARPKDAGTAASQRSAGGTPRHRRFFLPNGQRINFQR